jgi:hypothetical protein
MRMWMDSRIRTNDSSNVGISHQDFTAASDRFLLRPFWQRFYIGVERWFRIELLPDLIHYKIGTIERRARKRIFKYTVLMPVPPLFYKQKTINVGRYVYKGENPKAIEKTGFLVTCEALCMYVC